MHVGDVTVSGCSRLRSNDDPDDDATDAAAAFSVPGDNASAGSFIFLRLGCGTGAGFLVLLGGAGPEWQVPAVGS